MSWLSRITLVIALAFVFLGAPPAQAFDKTKFSGLVVLRCNPLYSPLPAREEVFSLDFSTMKANHQWNTQSDALVLQWVGDGPVIKVDSIHGYDHYEVNLETAIVTDNHDPAHFSYPCHDDGGLIPAPEYTDAGKAQIEAEARPSVGDAKAAGKKLTPAQKAQAQAKFAQAFDLFKAGDFDAAILGFKQGLDIDPSSGLANFYLGESYARTNKDYLAKIRWQRTIDLAPGSKEALQAQVRLTKQ